MVATSFALIVKKWMKSLTVLFAFLFTQSSFALQLPDERIDASYHSYSGGDVDVNGPAVLVRKNIKQAYSVVAGFHVDDITNASVDAVTQASAYTDQRLEYNVGFDYLYNDSLFSGSLIQSDEDDYSSILLGFSLTQEMFEGLTFVTLGYSRGYDDVGRINTDFSEEIDRDQFRISWRQIVTKRWVVDTTYELIDERGFLSNPYRGARQNCVFGEEIICAVVPERHPSTRASHALGVTNFYFLGFDSVARVWYRFFTDSWDITANEIEIGLASQIKEKLTFDVNYRFYAQSSANFYFDNATLETNYLSRDKELSEFTGHTIGFDVIYKLIIPEGYQVDSINLGVSFDFVHQGYDNFTDIRNGSLYTLDATMLQVFLSGVF